MTIEDDKTASVLFVTEATDGFNRQIEIARGAKRLFDITIAAAGLLLFSPIFVVVSAAIRLDSPGRVIVRETLYRYGNCPIRVFKFRSMANLNSDPASAGGVLCPTGIAGLPQLFNVLCGDMSIVGPSLYAKRQSQLPEELAASLNSFKPGLTGPSEIREYPVQRINEDLKYVTRWSLMLDIKIIFVILTSKKTYAVSQSLIRTGSGALLDQ